MTNTAIELWLERSSLILGFLSFWLAAPELLGEERLRKLERAIERPIQRHVASAVFALTIIGPTAYILWKGSPEFFNTTHPAVVIILLTAAMVVLNLIGVFLWFRAQRWADRLVRRLEDDSKIRERCLVAGAALFILSFALQFIATFFRT